MRISDWSADVCSSDLRRHTEAATALLERNGLSVRDVHVIGYHGQTIAHRPDRGWTWQKFASASCRERVCRFEEISVVAVSLRNKAKNIQHPMYSNTVIIYFHYHY